MMAMAATQIPSGLRDVFLQVVAGGHCSISRFGNAVHYHTSKPKDIRLEVKRSEFAVKRYMNKKLANNEKNDELGR